MHQRINSHYHVFNAGNTHTVPSRVAYTKFPRNNGQRTSLSGAFKAGLETDFGLLAGKGRGGGGSRRGARGARGGHIDFRVGGISDSQLAPVYGSIRCMCVHVHVCVCAGRRAVLMMAVPVWCIFSLRTICSTI